ncbi:peptide deformylase [Agrobacterium fabrum]|uniref:peptide deformylase n=1 Tax=Agrobacterium fabrum TaxID=1176649 RepID=UPI003BA1DE1E
MHGARTPSSDTLDEVRSRHGFGRALAAPQIGSPFRLIAFNCALGRIMAVNPEITWSSPGQQTVWDDCFSLLGTCMGVKRHSSISFRCHDLEGREPFYERLDFSLSELVQHEIDHLDGLLMMDRLLAPTAIIARETAENAIVSGF